MDKILKETIEAVYNINCDIDDVAESTGLELQHLTVKTDGFTFVVKIMDCVVFHSEDDERECCEDDEDTYKETVEQHLRGNIGDVTYMAGMVEKAIKKKA